MSRGTPNSKFIGQNFIVLQQMVAPWLETTALDVRMYFNISIICPLQQQWLPAEVASGAGGHELPAISLLGPFMAVSVFADENPNVAEKFFSGKQSATTVRSVAQTLQQDLEFMRVSSCRQSIQRK